MRRDLLLVATVVAVVLASCTKVSELDPAIVSTTSAQSPIEFTTYASSATDTKGTAVTSNSEFQSVLGSFDVSALIGDCIWKLDYTSSSDGTFTSYDMCPIDGSAVSYFGLSSVEYSSGWVNIDKMYWPNSSKIVYFAAISPSGLIEDFEFTHTISDADHTVDDDNGDFTNSAEESITADTEYKETYGYSFDYTVDSLSAKQTDIMYAVTAAKYLAPSDQEKSTGVAYITSGAVDTNDDDPVNLHFKHALTQIAFTATKDAAIDVYVKSLKVCNVYNSGKFTATTTTDDSDADADSNPTVGDGDVENDKVNANNFGTWEANYEGEWALVDVDENTTLSGGYTAAAGGYSAMSNYAATLVDNNTTSPGNVGAIGIGITESETTQLTSTSDVLMLMPQVLTAWVPTTSTELNYVGSYHTGSSSTGVSYADGGLADGTYANPSMNSAERTLSYLAIDCEIYHTGATDYGAKIHDGYIFVPFETKDIAYDSASVDDPTTITDEWLAGYKITYCLNFGGGYIVEEGDHSTIPEPGCIPDTKTYTLRPVTYTVTVDDWVETDAAQDLGEYSAS